VFFKGEKGELDKKPVMGEKERTDKRLLEVREGRLMRVVNSPLPFFLKVLSR
jgi:hypothetical protein